MGGKCYHHQMHSFIQKAIRKRFESLRYTKPHNGNENMMKEVLCLLMEGWVHLASENILKRRRFVQIILGLR